MTCKPLITIAVVLALSCATAARAEKAAEEGKAAPAPPAGQASPAAAAAQEKEPAAPAKPAASPDELARLLQERQQDLDRRETAVRKDEERVKLLRLSIEALLKKQAKQNAKTQASAAAGASSMAHVSQAFEAMPVEEAAQRIEKMNDHLAVEMLSRLKSKTTGQILAAINPAKAARLVEKLAVRPPGGGGDGPAKGVKN